MLIPLRHERMRGRRWPYFTFALIALNIVIFLATHWTIDAQMALQVPTRIHLILLAATHPDLQPSPEAAEFINKVKEASGVSWDQPSSARRPAHDAWESQLRQINDPAQLQAEMDQLSSEFAAEQKSSLLEHYAFIPIIPTLWPISPLIFFTVVGFISLAISGSSGWLDLFLKTLGAGSSTHSSTSWLGLRRYSFMPGVLQAV